MIISNKKLEELRQLLIVGRTITAIEEIEILLNRKNMINEDKLEDFKGKLIMLSSHKIVNVTNEELNSMGFKTRWIHLALDELVNRGDITIEKRRIGPKVGVVRYIYLNS
jgi:hypothetical protein